MNTTLTPISTPAELIPFFCMDLNFELIGTNFISIFNKERFYHIKKERFLKNLSKFIDNNKSISYKEGDLIICINIEMIKIYDSIKDTFIRTSQFMSFERAYQKSLLSFLNKEDKILQKYSCEITEFLPKLHSYERLILQFQYFNNSVILIDAEIKAIVLDKIDPICDIQEMPFKSIDLSPYELKNFKTREDWLKIEHKLTEFMNLEDDKVDEFIEREEAIYKAINHLNIISDRQIYNIINELNNPEIQITGETAIELLTLTKFDYLDFYGVDLNKELLKESILVNLLNNSVEYENWDAIPMILNQLALIKDYIHKPESMLISLLNLKDSEYPTTLDFSEIKKVFDRHNRNNSNLNWNLKLLLDLSFR